MGAQQIAIVKFKTKRVSDSITRPTNTTDYAAGDVISEATTNDHFTFQDCGDEPTFTGTIDAARLSSSAYVSTAPDAELWLFHTDIAEVADNSAAAITDAENRTLIGIIDFPTANWKTGNPASGASGNHVCETRNIGLPFVLAKVKDAPHIYGQLIVRNAYVPVSGEIFTVELSIYQD